MPIAAICNTCGHTETHNMNDSFDGFIIKLNQKGWRLGNSKTICPQCENGRQEVLEDLTIITYSLHELRHAPCMWGGLYWLWHKGGAYREMFHLPNDQYFVSEEDAKEYARQDALKKIRNVEWP